MVSEFFGSDVFFKSTPKAFSKNDYKDILTKFKLDNFLVNPS
jgi:hypothetical protein